MEVMNMYQALYRKYRPSNFDEVTGQEVIKKTLQNAIINNKLSHAYLFTGPRGTGKTSIAKILAKTINCSQLEKYVPCDVCVNCTQINNKQYTDIIEIDAASNNGIDEIREIRNKVNLVPSTGKYKVYIIDEVHMLTTGAFNALLKTLEEPPAHVIFILATTEPHKIPSTILSRCQRFDFKKIPNNQIVNRLKEISQKEKISIDDQALYEIARISDGGMRDSISLLDQVLSYSPTNISVDDVHEINGSLPIEKLSLFTNMLINKNLNELLIVIDEFNNSGKNLIKITEELVNHLKNILLYKISPDYFNKINSSDDLYKNDSDRFDRNQIIDIISKFNVLIGEIKVSSDPKLAMELLIIKECLDGQIVDTGMLSNEFVKFNKEEKTKKQEQKKEETIKNEEKSFQQAKEQFDNIFETDPILDKFKAMRINNTLARFDKNLLVNFKNKLHKLDDYLLDDSYGVYASMIIDGELKAASSEYLIFVFKTESLANTFNQNILTIQELFEKILDQKLKIISTDSISWEIIKKEFNSKKKEFQYSQESPQIEQDIFSMNNPKEIKELDNIFGDIVEYN
jgi:DNA polymerase-3 subunit gamma/tau